MNIKQASILVVDDEPVLREIMALWLQRSAGRVFSAEDGAEALKILSANHVDLIISDVRMPVMDGITLFEKMTEQGAQAPPMLLITGFSDISLREAYQMGVEAILEKPIERETLLKAAQRSLRDVEELWREPSSDALPQTKLEMSFAGLTEALQQGHIAFGRGGICIQTEKNLYRDPLEFKLNFQADQQLISGHGIVRWTAPQERLAGIEIVYLDEASRHWMVNLLKQTKPAAFIPSTAKMREQPERSTGARAS